MTPPTHTAAPDVPRYVRDLGEIERRWARAWHSLDCSSAHPIEDHEPFDVDDDLIPWSDVVAALAKEGVYLVSRESLAAALSNLNVADGYYAFDGHTDGEAADAILEQIGEHSDAR